MRRAVWLLQEQLEAFQAEKEALLGLTKDAKTDLEKLGRDYARLLGHQNQRQKIKHVIKLKEDNNALKTVTSISQSAENNNILFD